jgi:hypothetical protein
MSAEVVRARNDAASSGHEDFRATPATPQTLLAWRTQKPEVLGRGFPGRMDRRGSTVCKLWAGRMPDETGPGFVRCVTDRRLRKPLRRSRCCDRETSCVIAFILKPAPCNVHRQLSVFHLIVGRSVYECILLEMTNAPFAI